MYIIFFLDFGVLLDFSDFAGVSQLEELILKKKEKLLQ